MKMWWKEDDEIEIIAYRRKSARLSALTENKKEKQKNNHSSAAISPSNNSNVNKKDVGDKEGKTVASDHLDGDDVAVLPTTKTEILALLPRPPPPETAKKGRKRKKLGDLAILSSQQDGENPKPENTSAQNETVPSTRRMPGRCMLEFILDILQRRDKNEIFAQPVNPEEVESYYRIIKEPMDFGTMRAKLQEGLYTSLEQFERDVLLISSNAMHFNSSATVFYKEARAIQELSQRVFQALKSDPENFESNLLFSKRIPASKRQVEAKASRSKLAKLGGLKIGVSESGSRNGRKKSTLPEMQKRKAYKPSISTQNELLVSSIYNGPKPLVPIEDQDYTYKESLLRFAEGLGPAAQEFARKKLGRFLTEAPRPKSQTPSTPTMQTQNLLLPTPSAPLPPVHPNRVHNPKRPNTILREKPRTSDISFIKKGVVVNVNGNASNSGSGNVASFTGGLNILKNSKESDRGGKVNPNATINGSIFSSKNSVQTEMNTAGANSSLNLDILKGKEMYANTSLNLNILNGQRVMTSEKIDFQGNYNRKNVIPHHHQYRNDSFRLASHFRVFKIENSTSPGAPKTPRLGYKAIDMMANANKQLGKQVQQSPKTDENHRKLIDFMSKSNKYLKSNFLPLQSFFPSETSYASQVLLASHALLSTQNFSPPPIPPQDIKFQSVLVHATLSSLAVPPLTLNSAPTEPELDLTRPETWAKSPVCNFTNLLMQTNYEEDYKAVNHGTSFVQELKSPSSAQGSMPLYPSNSLQERAIDQYPQSGSTSQLYHVDQQLSLMDNQHPDLALQL
ncbi:uncharacterized protein LOC112489561 isoform X2 [Ziziphus jujuba]|uniref:Uncharacterized protein LOC112489561 isoform X2 n=1 Tax=Ziziphus jujuba TaxID=326968 RepID=A0ABM3IAT6_ZIZJJ|nr:uncharacterized protein LOC112489561 isoform X2 [Ziziphus jujuba]